MTEITAPARCDGERLRVRLDVTLPWVLSRLTLVARFPCDEGPLSSLMERKLAKKSVVSLKTGCAATVAMIWRHSSTRRLYGNKALR